MIADDISLVDLELIKYKCPRCKHIFRAQLIVKKCPACNFGETNKFVLYDFYPNTSSIDILYSLVELMKLTGIRELQIIKHIQEELNKELNIVFSHDVIKNVLKDLYSFDSVSEKLRISVKKKLNITDDEVVEQAYDVFSSGDNLNRLNKSIVLLSATLIEILFKDFMQDVITKRTDEVVARGIMESLVSKSIHEHIIQFEIFLKRKFQSILETPHEKFLTKWSSLREDRNKIIHKNSIHVTPNRITEIYQFATSSVNLFAELSNNLDRLINEGNDIT
jgi:hypothetical protein